MLVLVSRVEEVEGHDDCLTGGGFGGMVVSWSCMCSDSGGFARYVGSALDFSVVVLDRCWNGRDVEDEGGRSDFYMYL